MKKYANKDEYLNTSSCFVKNINEIEIDEDILSPIEDEKGNYIGERFIVKDYELSDEDHTEDYWSVKV